MAGGSDSVSGDLSVTRSVVIPAAELSWRFSRSSGPGGQSVNTSDSRVELVWDLGRSTALSAQQRSRALRRLQHRLVDGAISVTASEQRSQWQNRHAARERLAGMIAGAIADPPPRRRPSRPTRGSVERRLQRKRGRSQVKRDRRRPPAE